MYLLRMAGNLFSTSTTTTLNEAHCRHENNSQRTVRQCRCLIPLHPQPWTYRSSAAKSPLFLDPEAILSRNFVLRPSSSSGRQSPISRSTEIQFKPLITTELSVHCLSSAIPNPLSLACPFLSIIVSLPPATLTATASIRSAPISATIQARARNGRGRRRGEGAGEAVCIFPI